MADIFISYRKTDGDEVARVVAAFEAAGLSCWIDRRLEAGDIWDDAIEREMNAAKCVVVFWSPESVLSRWVRTEATEGLERGILVPVMLDGARPPLAFKLVQAVDLTGWTGDSRDARIGTLIAKVRTVTSKSSAKLVEGNKATIREKVHQFLVGMCLVSIVAAGIGAYYGKNDDYTFASLSFLLFLTAGGLGALLDKFWKN
jgi:hypothetical protein